MVYTRIPVFLVVCAVTVFGAAKVEVSVDSEVPGNRGMVAVHSAIPGTRLQIFDGIRPGGVISVDDSGEARFLTPSLTSGAHVLRAVEWGTGKLAGSSVRVDIKAQPSHSFEPRAAYSGGMPPNLIASADLDGSGYPDVILAGAGTVALLQNRGGIFGSPLELMKNREATAIAVQDFNGDGHNDLAIAGSDGHVAVLLNLGDGQFTPARSFPIGSSPSTLVSADFNGDGIPDLIAAHCDGHDLSLLLGNGDGSFQPATLIPAGDSPQALAVADFNRDGIADLAVASFTTGEITILLGNGRGGFRGTSVASAGNGPARLLAADFDGDGSPDLAVFNQLDNSVNVLLNDGAAALHTVYSIAGASAVAAGDIDGDGFVDLVIQSGGVLRVHRSRGNGSFDEAAATRLPGASSLLELDDFNGDGTLDIAAVTSTGSLTVDAGRPLSFRRKQPGFTPAGKNVTTASTGLLASVAPLVAIDSPAADSAVSGVITVTGWAIDNGSFAGTAIRSVVVKVDGAVVGNALYGISRVDVCNAYPGRPNCPNVGYSFQLNTNGLATGNHTITVSASNSDAVPTVGSATISVSATYIPPMVAIDAPLPGSVLSGIATISGWALDNQATGGTPISNVQIRVDGTLLGSATYGLNRGDVCGAYPGRPGCPNVGYSYSLNTTALTAGSHVITVSAYDSLNYVGSRSVAITVAGGPPSVFIDSPTSGAVLSGPVTITGWALDNIASIGTAISTVVVKVDGSTVGNATYGISRTDICGIYTGRPGCPNVGFSYVLDTTRLALGSHMLSVIATDGDGSPQSSTWAIPFQVIAPPSVHLDAPAPGSTVSGTISVSGWALDSTTAIGTAISSVKIQVDGTLVGTAIYGLNRGDVCGAYPGRPGCPNVGFTYSLNTALLTVGTHVLTAIATDSYNTPGMGSASISINVGPPPPPAIYIDSISPGATVSGTVAVSGWALDNLLGIGTTISSVRILVDGATVGTATYGTSRSDVCGAYPGRPGCPNVGFTYALRTGGLSAGAHTITAVATSGYDVSGSASLRVTVGALPPPQVQIDTPSLGATISGVVTVSGWALGNTSAVSAVQVLIDGAPAGTASYGGSRSDVCGAYPGRPGCPNVGFTFDLNSALFSAGAHTLKVAAIDGNGTTGSSSFAINVVSNIALTSSANPAMYGQPLTLTARLSATSATGRMTFYDGSSVLGTAAVANGQCALTTTLLASGAHSIRAYYGGDNSNQATSSTALQVSIYNVSASGFTPAANYFTGSSPYGVVVGDFNGDGKTDLVIANSGDFPAYSGTVTVLLGGGDGTFRLGSNYTTGVGSSAVAVADFNADGKADLVVANWDGSVSVLSGRGDGTFTGPVTYRVGTSPFSVVVGDLNGDGKPDVVVANNGDNSFSVLLGRGDGTFAPALTYAAGPAPQSIAIGDFNGDGKADLAIAGLNGVSVLSGNGNGTFQAPVNYVAGSNPYSVLVGDFNGDGKADLAVTNLDSNSVSVLLGNGDSSFQPALSYAVGSNPECVVLGDFNGDGKPDLAVASFGSSSGAAGNVSILQSNGDGTFKPAVNYSAGSNPFFAAVGDFNGDGRADLAVVNVNGGNASILLGKP